MEKSTNLCFFMLIDTHAHLSFPQFGRDFLKVIERAKAVGVSRIVNVGCDLESSSAVVDMLVHDECLYATLGMHPYEACDVDDELMEKWRGLIERESRIVAVGECGLDYFKAEIPHDEQKEAFRGQLELAKKVDLPVIVHNRDADEDCVSILDEFDGLGVVFHCYGSGLEFARKLWKRGIFTSFTGIISYPNASDLREVVKEVPDELFMIETDCPYLAPQMYRGQRNEPAFVENVAHEVAEIRGVSFEKIAEKSSANAMKFFGLPE